MLTRLARGAGVVWVRPHHTVWWPAWQGAISSLSEILTKEVVGVRRIPHRDELLVEILEPRVIARAVHSEGGADLAESLDSMANLLRELGRNEESITVAQQTVELYHSLVATHPDRYLPPLAAAMRTLGNSLSVAGRHQEASQAARAATEAEQLSHVPSDVRRLVISFRTGASHVVTHHRPRRPRVLPVCRPSRDHFGYPRTRRRHPVGHRGMLATSQDRNRAGPLPGPRLAALVPARHAGHARPRLPGGSGHPHARRSGLLTCVNALP